MASLGGELESDSSDEEWVFTSTKTSSKTQQRLSITASSIRTLKANIPKRAAPPPSHHVSQIIPTLQQKKLIVKQPSLQFISDKELATMCNEMNATLLVSRLVDVYKSCEIFIRIREIETQAMSIEMRLKDHLSHASDPCDFILVSLSLFLHIRMLISSFLEYAIVSFDTLLQ